MKDALQKAAREYGGKVAGFGVAITILWGVVSKMMDEMEQMHEEIHDLKVQVATLDAVRKNSQAEERAKYE